MSSLWRKHEQDNLREETPFCGACQAEDHISLDATCPTIAFNAKSSPLPKKSAAAKSKRGEEPATISKKTRHLAADMAAAGSIDCGNETPVRLARDLSVSNKHGQH
ncbi:hypothetical protein MRX96_032632 [Rhipicephalus microplus]